MTRTLVIGVDAASWDVIDRLRELDDLSHINSLIKNGATGVLDSTIPPMTPPAWMSMVTGVNPGKHGVYDFVDIDKNEYQIDVNSRNISTPAVWDVFNAKNRSVGIVNFPLIHPPPKVDSFFISGTPFPNSDNIGYPEQVQRHLDSIEYYANPNVNPEDDPEQYFEEVTRITDTQCNVAIHMLEEYDVDLLWTVFMGIDWIQHDLWGTQIGDEDAVERIYRYFDEVIGRLIDTMGDECNIALISDHGAREIEAEIYMNNLLKELGYLRPQESRKGPIQRVKNRTTDVVWELSKLLPPNTKSAIKYRLANSVLREIRDVLGPGKRKLGQLIDWEGTIAFSYGSMGQVYIHTEHQYPSGVVDKSEYEAVRETVAKDLRTVNHPETGEPLFDRVIKTEQIHPEMGCSDGPGLICIPADWKFSVYGDIVSSTTVTEPTKRLADHKREGVVILSGPAFKETTIDATVTDVTPTLLYLNSLPLLSSMDGTVIEEAFTHEFLDTMETHVASKSDVGLIDAATVEQPDQGEVKDRLSDLGYL